MANPPKREKDSSLPPSLIPHLFSGPQQRQGSSPTGSTGTQEEAELPASTFEPRPTASPLRPLVPSPLPPLPVPFPDTRRQYPAYESGVHTDPVILHPPAGPLPIPERPGGPSSIPHGSARGYRIPVISDPTYPTPVRLQGPVYLGSHSLPPVLPQTTLARTHWREGEAGPSSLVQSHPYGGISRQRNPSYPPPQPIYRRATEPGGYSTPPSHIQPPLHSSYERLRLQEPPLGGYPPRPPSENPYAEAAQSTLSLPPLYTREDWPYGVPGNVREQGDLPPLYSAIQSQSPASSDYTRIGDGDYHPGQHRKADHDEFESNPRQTKIQKKILVACRKLRCDGVKPTCCNCVSRGITARVSDAGIRFGRTFEFITERRRQIRLAATVARGDATGEKTVEEQKAGTELGTQPATARQRAKTMRRSTDLDVTSAASFYVPVAVLIPFQAHSERFATPPTITFYPGVGAVSVPLPY
ncbi:hypothetical protein C8R44DRAFT_977199 [Mycena epipterygia]|nr:hypothetical protein C8R44DRAFT_977199 [Mycena epipterygia]